MKKTVSVILAVILIISLMSVASAAHVSLDEAAVVLKTLGLVKGSDAGLEEYRAPTRYESLVMLTRLLGLESEALSWRGEHPFSDAKGSWAERYLGYAYEHGITVGVGPESFAGDDNATIRDYLTMVLRALDYVDNEDFSWSSSISFSDDIGLSHGEYSTSSVFLREDLILISYTALTTKIKGSSITLIESLYRSGVVSYSALVSTRLAKYVNTGKTAYTSDEIYEKCSSSVFLSEMYETQYAYTSNFPSATASGFFVSADGMAVMSYHAIEDARYARATTTDGRSFDISEVLWYSVGDDIAVVRVSKTDTSGKTISRFPYINVGNSDAATPGIAVYTVSSPLGLSNSFSSGVVSAVDRKVLGLECACIQATVPVSQGSSGGPLINEYGEAIGLVYGAYISGNSLNLFIPINLMKNIPMKNPGITLSQLYEKNAAG